MTTRLAEYLLENPLYAYGNQVSQLGSSTAPVRSPLEGLARALTGGVGGFFEGQGLRQAKGEQKLDQTALADAMTKYTTDPAGARALLATRPNLSDVATTLLTNDVGFQRQKDLLTYKDQLDQQGQTRDMQMFGLAPNAGTPMPATAGSGGGGAASAIAANESGGRYDAVGPAANSAGNRAYGKYQVLDTNIGPWTQEVLGKPMSPQEFLASPDAQEKVFQTKFGQYRQKYGDQGAARAWFAGEGGMNNPNAKDVLGTSVAQYADRFAANGGVSQGASPQIAPGQPVPQQGLNAQPNADTINFQGIPLPRASIAAALAIRDPKERQGKLTDIVRDAVKSQQGPDPGTTAGDVHVLEQVRANPALASDPTYHAAYNRVGEPKMSQSGQLLRPDMSAYPKPVGERGQIQPQAQIEDTPNSRFQMEDKLRNDFNAQKPVKDFREVAPIVSSMEDALKRDNKVSDLNLIYGLAKVMDPASVVREGEMVMVRNTQSLPDWVKGALNSALSGKSQFAPEQRDKIMQEVRSRASAMKAQHDAYVQQYGGIAQRYNLNPDNIVNSPLVGAGSQGDQGQPQAGPVRIDINGKPL